MLSIMDIKYKYPKKENFALHDITFSVNAGEVFTLLGPNGAGKTTLIRIISGLIMPIQGTVIIDRNDILSQEDRARQAIGLVLGDERAFYYRLTGSQNLEFFGGRGGPSDGRVRGRGWVPALAYYIFLPRCRCRGMLLSV